MNHKTDMKTGIINISNKYPLITEKPKWTFSNNKTLRRWFQTRVNGLSLHLCYGRTRLDGCVNVDIVKTDAVDVVADMFHLPFRDNAFDTILSDPPYKLAYNKRPFFINEMTGVAKKKKGSSIVLKLDFIPYFPEFGLSELYIYQGRRYWAHVSLLLKFEYKNNSKPETLEKYIHI